MEATTTVRAASDTLGRIGDLANIPQTFSLEMPDNALCDTTPRGTQLVMERVKPGERITPNRVILVADRDGHGLVRRYGEADSGAWMALAEHKDFRPLHSVEDGLALIGKLRWIAIDGKDY